MRARVEIPAPLFVEGAACEVLNYRKQQTTWERGTVARAPIFTWAKLAASIKTAGEPGRWDYTVELDRRSESGNRIHLTVSDDRIRPCQQ